MKPNLLINIPQIYRIKDWRHFLGLTFLGYLCDKPFCSSYYLLIKIVISGLLLAFAFSWNEFFDRKFSKKRVFFPLTPLFLILLLVKFLNPATKILTLLFFLVALLYSLPPIRLKSYPFIGTFCNAFGFSLLFLIGVDNFENQIVLPLYLGLFSLLCVAQLIHELTHAPQDKSERILTTTLFLGEKKTKILLLSFLVLAFLSFCKFSFLIAGFLLLSASHITVLLTKKEINYSHLRKIYRYDGLVLGIVIFLYLLFISP
jgi:hypothetical protein